MGPTTNGSCMFNHMAFLFGCEYILLFLYIYIYIYLEEKGKKRKQKRVELIMAMELKAQKMSAERVLESSRCGSLSHVQYY